LREDAGAFARDVVAARLVACAQVDGPVASHYFWEGKLHCEEEWRVTVKFPAGNADALEAWLLAHHPYENPQWVCARVVRGAPKYIRWVKESCHKNKAHNSTTD
jgi:periplasmic divalent cation tolerance protein